MNRSTQELFEGRTREDVVLAPEVGKLKELGTPQDSPFLAITRFLWARRVQLAKAAALSLVVAALITILIPNSYDADVQLMPPDSASSGVSALATMMAKGNLGVGSALLGDLLGEKNTGALFLGVLRSRTVEDRIINKF